MKRLSAIKAAPLLGWLLFIMVLEARWPLRRTVEPKLRRFGRNFVVGGLSLAVVWFLQRPLWAPLARWTEHAQLGLLQKDALPESVRLVAGVILFDYTLWFWHWMNHRIPLFWRFHLVHHVDRDLDASTALRFHFVELTLSGGYRALQILVIGAGATALAVWQMLLFLSVVFHHSNLRLPGRLESVLVRAIVTPRMHGIHHSNRRDETNSNWSSLLSVWDYLHGTLRLDVPQKSVTIGVPAYSHERDVTLGKILVLPFRRQRNDWLSAE